MTDTSNAKHARQYKYSLDVLATSVDRLMKDFQSAKKDDFMALEKDLLLLKINGDAKCLKILTLQAGFTSLGEIFMGGVYDVKDMGIGSYTEKRSHCLKGLGEILVDAIYQDKHAESVCIDVCDYMKVMLEKRFGGSLGFPPPR